MHPESVVSQSPVACLCSVFNSMRHSEHSAAKTHTSCNVLSTCQQVLKGCWMRKCHHFPGNWNKAEDTAHSDLTKD